MPTRNHKMPLPLEADGDSRVWEIAGPKVGTVGEKRNHFILNTVSMTHTQHLESKPRAVYYERRYPFRSRVHVVQI
jgi:hypothetical protein